MSRAKRPRSGNTSLQWKWCSAACRRMKSCGYSLQPNTRHLVPSRSAGLQTPTSDPFEPRRLGTINRSLRPLPLRSRRKPILPPFRRLLDLVLLEQAVQGAAVDVRPNLPRAVLVKRDAVPLHQNRTRRICSGRGRARRRPSHGHHGGPARQGPFVVWGVGRLRSPGRVVGQRGRTGGASGGKSGAEPAVGGRPPRLQGTHLPRAL